MSGSFSRLETVDSLPIFGIRRQTQLIRILAVTKRKGVYQQVSVPEIPDICDLDDAVELKKGDSKFLCWIRILYRIEVAETADIGRLLFCFVSS